MEVFRLVQITDLHICKNPDTLIAGGNPELGLTEALRIINSMESPPKAILATGDLAEDGLPETYQRLSRIFSTAQAPVFCLPGNHDNPLAMHANLSAPNVAVESEAVFGDWRVIFLNSAIMGNDHGTITTELLSDLKMRLETDIEKFCVVALHHSPTPECLSAGCQLEHSEQLLSLLSEYPQVKCVVAGHTHHDTDCTHQHIQLLTTPSTFLYADHHAKNNNDDFEITHTLDHQKRGFRIIDLHPNGKVDSEIIWF